MKLKTFDSKLIDFLSDQNTVIVENRQEYQTFCNLMNSVGLSTEFLDKIAKTKNYDILVEYNNSKGFTIWNFVDRKETAIRKSAEWYYNQPFTINDINFNQEDN